MAVNVLTSNFKNFIVIVTIAGDGDDSAVGDAEQVASSRQQEQHELEASGECSHLIVWQASVQN
jgi:hypothetical protein